MPKISDLDPGTTVTGAEYAAWVQNGETVRLTAAEILSGGTLTSPIVMFSTGQSNFYRRETYSWSPSPNMTKWNYDFTDGNIGTLFEAPPSTTINLPEKIASDIARANPSRHVYLINIPFHGIDISHWLVGATAPDMYANITANMVPALAAIGITKIDVCYYWQGETQTTSPELFFDNLNTLFARFRGETWFPRSTPILIYTTSPTSVSGLIASDKTNAAIQAFVRYEPDLRRAIWPGALGASNWQDIYHLSAAGYNLAGTMGANAFLYGESHQPALEANTGFIGAAAGRTAFRNLMRGGDLGINTWRYGTTFVSPATATTILDGVAYKKAGAGVVTISQDTDVPTLAQAGVYTAYSLTIAPTTADASIASSDFYGLEVTIPGSDVSFLGFGQTGAKNIVISFWRKETITGNYFVSVENSAQNRSYVAAYTMNAADTWEKKFVTIPGDTTGTWLYTPTSDGLKLEFPISAGDDYQTTVDTWTAGNLRVGTGTRANAMSSTSNRSKFALFQVEEGVYPSVFDRVPETIPRKKGDTFTETTLVAPALGAATGTSLALGGATIGSNALAVTGSSALGATTVSATMTPLANDGAALGTGALSFSDLFLASGGVLNFNNGNYTITHSAGTLAFSGAVNISSTLSVASPSASALTVGLGGGSNPALQVDASTASSATGIKIKSAAAAGGAALSVITSGTNENLTIDAAGSGTITLGGTSTGPIIHARASTFSAAITYGGVTLNNAVTGTGNMVLSASPTFTGTVAGTNVIPNATLGTMANNTIKGRVTAGTGSPEDMTAAQTQSVTSQGYIVFSVSGVNANSANTDTAVTITLPTGYTKYRIANVFSYNPSTSLTTATAGVFTSTGGGGVAVVSNVALSALTTGTADTAGSFLNHTVTLSVTAYFNDATLYYRIGTAQGSAATVDFAIYIQALK